MQRADGLDFEFDAVRRCESGSASPGQQSRARAAASPDVTDDDDSTTVLTMSTPPNHALQRTRLSFVGGDSVRPRVAGSLSLGR